MRASLGVVLLLLAACAGAPQWHKEGVTKEATEADLYTCKTSAPIEPRVQGARGMPSGLGRNTAFDTMAEREGQRFQDDARFAAECMRAKGYSDAKK